jgi:dTDP-4-dehydrorhamnose 3,5-epimerase
VRITEQELAGIFLLEPQAERDERGYFARVFDAAALAALGLETVFPERGIAANDRAGTVRGLHYAAAPHGETKIVTCLRGAIYDIVLDLRENSMTQGRWFACELSAQRLTSLYIPRGFAHGYQTLTDDTFVAYDISTPYVAAAARGINHSDAQLAIPWPRPVSVISQRDKSLPPFIEVTAHG